MRSDGLGVLNRAAVPHVVGNAGGPEGVAVGGRGDADFTAVAAQSKGLKVSSIDQLRPLATALEKCISEAAKRPTPDTMPVAQLAAGCFILMDADKGHR